MMQLDNFKASQGWIDKFKSRHGLCTKVMAGEVESVSETVQSYRLFSLNGLIVQDLTLEKKSFVQPVKHILQMLFFLKFEAYRLWNGWGTLRKRVA